MSKAKPRTTRRQPSAEKREQTAETVDKTSDEQPRDEAPSGDQSGGIECPKCGATNLASISKTRTGRQAIRTRECRNCQTRFKTEERRIAKNRGDDTCPECGSTTEVQKTRRGDGSIRRDRRCVACECVFDSVERRLGEFAADEPRI